MIPKKIHYCWFGLNQKSDLNKKCLESWRRLLPDYEIKEWNENNSPLHHEYCQASYRQGLWSRLSNYIRLFALYTEGGIYLDTDVEVLKSFSPFISDKCFLGFQLIQEQSDWVSSAVLGSVRGHPFLRRCLLLTETTFAATGQFYRSPTVMTMVLKSLGLSEYKQQEIEEVVVYPVDYFYPYAWFENFSPACITTNTHCIHHWEGTWTKPTK
jgi:mannosyltransferase OCH1-like enzyme